MYYLCLSHRDLEQECTCTISVCHIEIYNRSVHILSLFVTWRSRTGVYMYYLCLSHRDVEQECTCTISVCHIEM